MKSAALLMVSCSPRPTPQRQSRIMATDTGLASIHHANTSGDRESHSGITCEMVRAYVAKVGLAKPLQWLNPVHHVIRGARARRCLAERANPSALFVWSPTRSG